LASLGAEALSVLELAQGKKEILRQNVAGKTEYLEFEVVPLKDRAGIRKGRLIFFANVTLRKEEELRLLQLTQAVEQSPASVVITDLEGKISYVNPKFTTLTGYSLEEVLGKNPKIIQSGHTPRETYQAMWQALRAGQAWSGELLNKKKNGDFYWELEIIAPARDHAGQIINYIAVKEDITQRKQAEQALQKANQQLERNLQEIQKLQDSLREQAIRDPLTGLYNRRFLEEAIEREFHRAARLAQPLSLVMLDIDHFKTVNDTYGHAAGDVCLVALAQLLADNVRKSDIVCRYGGEEFLLMLLDTGLESAVQHAEKIRSLFETTEIVFEGKPIKATISLGMAAYPAHGKNHEEVIKKADQALYAAKNAGRNRVTNWAESLGQ
jgi:diguanylate cyclase (GGDEF)-like protein/PAS domain S-box-containing protein